MEYFQKLDGASSIELPVGKVKLSNGIEAQVILKVVTEPNEFLYCENYYTK